jgi:hypothetical protein
LQSKTLKSTEFTSGDLDQIMGSPRNLFRGADCPPAAQEKAIAAAKAMAEE